MAAEASASYSSSSFSQQQRGGAELQPALAYLVRDGESARKRLRSLWALHISGGVSDHMTLELLGDADENLVSWYRGFQFSIVAGHSDHLFKLGTFSEHAKIQHSPGASVVFYDHVGVIKNIRHFAIVHFIEVIY